MCLFLDLLPLPEREKTISVSTGQRKAGERWPRRDVSLPHTRAHTHGGGAICVGERRRGGSIEQPPLSAVNHERRQKPPVFPPCSGLGATANTLSHTLTLSHTCIRSGGVQAGIRGKERSACAQEPRSNISAKTERTASEEDGFLRAPSLGRLSGVSRLPLPLPRLRFLLT